jgi:hypothetical protein
MVAIKKRDGRKEAFNASKLERSLRTAGASERVAREVARAVRVHEGMTVTDVRALASRELRRRDPRAADRYDGTRQLVARAAVDAVQGTALMTDGSMQALRVGRGEDVELTFYGRTHRLRAERAPPGARGIQLDPAEMTALGARDGARVIVRRAA